MCVLGVTLARRVCMFCGGNEGFRLWPWSGRVYVTTHTVCRHCAHTHGERALGRAEGARAA
jgi:hypothetical protein